MESETTPNCLERIDIGEKCDNPLGCRCFRVGFELFAECRKDESCIDFDDKLECSIVLTENTECDYDKDCFCTKTRSASSCSVKISPKSSCQVLFGLPKSSSDLTIFGKQCLVAQGCRCGIEFFLTDFKCELNQFCINLLGSDFNCVDQMAAYGDICREAKCFCSQKQEKTYDQSIKFVLCDKNSICSFYQNSPICISDFVEVGNKCAKDVCGCGDASSSSEKKVAMCRFDELCSLDQAGEYSCSDGDSFLDSLEASIKDKTKCKNPQNPIAITVECPIGFFCLSGEHKNQCVKKLIFVDTNCWGAESCICYDKTSSKNDKIEPIICKTDTTCIKISNKLVCISSTIGVGYTCQHDKCLCVAEIRLTKI